MTVNERIRVVRNSLNLTQEKFAKQISISTSYLAGIETGARDANNRVIRLIGNAFNVDEHWLKTGEGEMLNEGADEDISRIIGCFKSLNPQYQELALKMMDFLSELDS